MSTFSDLERLGFVFLVTMIFYIAKGVIKFVYSNIIAPLVYKMDFKSKGKWALVTGCTDGIGKAYARELASRGCDIVLVSRSMDKLMETASAIEADYKVNTMIVQADFNQTGIYEIIAREIADLEIGTLVNNVGVSYKYPEYFLDIPDWEDSINTMIKTNIISATRMTGIVMPGMVKRGKGVVINIGSGSSIIPSPLLTVYAATKAYIEKFSEGLDLEYSKKGIIVQCVLPGLVCTNMSRIRRGTIMAPTAKTFVKSAISLVGTVTKTSGYFPHTVFFYFINYIHKTVKALSVWLVTRSMENTRIKALKKYKKE